MKRPGRRRESESNRNQNNQHSSNGNNSNNSNNNNNNNSNNSNTAAAPSVTSNRTSILDLESETSSRHKDADTIRAAAPPFGALGFLPDSPTASGAMLPDLGTSNSGNNTNNNSNHHGLFGLTPSSITNNIPSPPPSDKTLTGGDGLSDMFSVLGETIRMRELADYNMNPEVGDMDFAMSAMDFVMSTMDSPFEFTALNSGDNNNTTYGNHHHDDISSLLMPVDMDMNIDSNIDPALSETSSSSMDMVAATTNAAVSHSDSLGLTLPAFQLSGSTVNTPKSSPSLSAAMTENPPACKCLVKSLDLLKTLSSGPPHCTSTSTSDGSNLNPDGGIATDTTCNTAITGQQDHFSRITLRENEQSIEAVIGILACKACADDGFLLTVSSMIVLKILDRYAAAARRHSSSLSLNSFPACSNSSSSNSHSSGSSYAASSRGGTPPRSTSASTSTSTSGLGPICGSGGGCIDSPSIALLGGGGHGNLTSYKSMSADTFPHPRCRTSAQIVLSELHRVQRLVNELSPKLRGFGAAAARNDLSGGGGYFGSRHGGGSGEQQQHGSSHFSNLGLGFGLGHVGHGNDISTSAAVENKPLTLTQAPLSPSPGTLEQVEADLRKNLRTLSEEIINVLRHL